MDPKQRSSSDVMLKWTAGAVFLLLLYFIAGPWFVLFLCAFNEVVMGGHDLIYGLAEWAMSPAIWVGERVEPYGEYFWDVLAPLGG